MIYCLLCPVCDTCLPVFKTSKGKTYCVCKGCGLTIMIGGNAGNEKLLEKAKEVDKTELTPENLTYYENKLKKSEYGREEQSQEG